MKVGTCNRIDELAQEIAKKIASSESAIVASHIDADGISAAAVASSALDNAGIRHEVIFLKKLDEEAIGMLRRRAEGSLVWLTDLGSAYASKFGTLVLSGVTRAEEALPSNSKMLGTPTRHWSQHSP